MRALARNTDHITSHQAARAVEASGMTGYHRNILLAFVRNNPGMTAAEIAHGSGLDRYEASRRLPELRRAGLLRNGDARKCSILFHKSLIWSAK